MNIITVGFKHKFVNRMIFVAVNNKGVLLSFLTSYKEKRLLQLLKGDLVISPVFSRYYEGPVIIEIQSLGKPLLLDRLSPEGNQRSQDYNDCQGTFNYCRSKPQARLLKHRSIFHHDSKHKDIVPWPIYCLSFV